MQIHEKKEYNKESVSFHDNFRLIKISIRLSKLLFSSKIIAWKKGRALASYQHTELENEENEEDE